MPRLSTAKLMNAAYRGALNLMTGHPLAASFEVTHSCNADCKHCDKGGPSTEIEISPKEIAQRCRELRPVVAQISGGEPLLRADIIEIVDEIRASRSCAILVLVTNGSLLTEGKYLELKRAGVDEFSLSLDYPDERHDEQRRIPGLFSHLLNLIPTIARYGHDDITTVTVLRKRNAADLPALAELSISWGAKPNFTAYTPLRTNNSDELPQTAEDRATFKAAVERLIAIGRETGRIVSSKAVLNRMARFCLERRTPPCRAGERCVVMNPDGGLTACAMFSKKRYTTRQKLIAAVSANNDCQGCYISMRGNTEKPFHELLFGNLSLVRRKARGR